jgi:hypothetical protein
MQSIHQTSCPQAIRAKQTLAPSSSRQLKKNALETSSNPKHPSSPQISLPFNASHSTPSFASSSIVRYSTRIFHQNKRHVKKKGQTMSNCGIAFRHGKPTGFVLLMMLSVIGVAQGASDCQIMIDWLPDMFNGDGTACCSQPGITCQGDRITEM